MQKVVKDLYIHDKHSEARAHATVIVLAPLSDEVYIRGDLHNTMQRGMIVYRLGAKF